MSQSKAKTGVFTIKVFFAVCVLVCVSACEQKHEPCVTSLTATPLQLVFREKQPGRSSHDAKFPPPHTKPARRTGDAVQRWGKAELNPGPVGGYLRGSSRHGRLPLFLLPAASFLDIIAVHVSLTAADWLDVWDQHKVTVVKCDMTAKHFRSQ